MTTAEAKESLRKMQSQIIHGSNVFGDIADCIAKLEAERDSLKANGTVCPRCGNYLPGHATGAGDICTCDPTPLRDREICRGKGW